MDSYANLPSRPWLSVPVTLARDRVTDDRIAEVVIHEDKLDAEENKYEQAAGCQEDCETSQQENLGKEAV